MSKDLNPGGVSISEPNWEIHVPRHSPLPALRFPSGDIRWRFHHSAAGRIRHQMRLADVIRGGRKKKKQRIGMVLDTPSISLGRVVILPASILGRKSVFPIKCDHPARACKNDCICHSLHAFSSRYYATECKTLSSGLFGTLLVSCNTPRRGVLFFFSFCLFATIFSQTFNRPFDCDHEWKLLHICERCSLGANYI